MQKIATDQLISSSTPDGLIKQLSREFYVNFSIDEDGRTILACYPDDIDADRQWIYGAVATDEDLFYVGCITCEQEIDFSDSGMCEYCREDQALGA